MAHFEDVDLLCGQFCPFKLVSIFGEFSPRIVFWDVCHSAVLLLLLLCAESHCYQRMLFCKSNEYCTLLCLFWSTSLECSSSAIQACFLKPPCEKHKNANGATGAEYRQQRGWDELLRRLWVWLHTQLHRLCFHNSFQADINVCITVDVEYNPSMFCWEPLTLLHLQRCSLYQSATQRSDPFIMGWLRRRRGLAEVRTKPACPIWRSCYLAEAPNHSRIKNSVPVSASSALPSHYSLFNLEKVCVRHSSEGKSSCLCRSEMKLLCNNTTVCRFEEFYGMMGDVTDPPGSGRVIGVSCSEQR